HPARQQWLAHSSNKVASRVLCFFLSGVFAGCSSSTPPEEALADIRQEMRRGELDLAFRHAEAEYQRYARRDSLLAWHFRVQKAHFLVVRGSYIEALQLLSDELPASLANSEAAARRKMVQGIANDYAQHFDLADKDLSEASEMARSIQPALLGDVIQAGW